MSQNVFSSIHEKSAVKTHFGELSLSVDKSTRAWMILSSFLLKQIRIATDCFNKRDSEHEHLCEEIRFQYA